VPYRSQSFLSRFLKARFANSNRGLFNEFLQCSDEKRAPPVYFPLTGLLRVCDQKSTLLHLVTDFFTIAARA
jgi:hypothetical protein